jgi:hypothetical protein
MYGGGGGEVVHHKKEMPRRWVSLCGILRMGFSKSRMEFLWFHRVSETFA